MNFSKKKKNIIGRISLEIVDAFADYDWPGKYLCNLGSGEHEVIFRSNKSFNSSTEVGNHVLWHEEYPIISSLCYAWDNTYKENRE
jgi:hypothetical protein